MTNLDFALLTRGKKFASVIDTTICTNAQGEALDIEDGLCQMIELFARNRSNGGHIYMIGNGGSAAVASHAVTDFVNVSRLRAFTLHESTLMTCMANDFGYDQVFKRIVSTMIKANDSLIAISSSGKSKNICDAAITAKEIGAAVITFSGFTADNPLRKMGDFNLWLNSNDYGLVEMGHLFILHNIVDRDQNAVALKDAEKRSIAALTV